MPKGFLYGVLNFEISTAIVGLKIKMFLCAIMSKREQGGKPSMSAHFRFIDYMDFLGYVWKSESTSPEH